MRALVIVAVVGVLAGTAHAQAPGQTEPGSVPAHRPDVDVMANRWSASLAIAPESMTPKGDSADEIGLTGIELAVRYRFKPMFEIGLTLDAAGAMMQGVDKLNAGGAWVDFRYRFRPMQRWNLIASAALGVQSVSGSSSSDIDKQGRGALRLGGGVERRFDVFAISAELHLYGISENTKADDNIGGISHPYEREGVSGVALALGGSYYF